MASLRALQHTRAGNNERQKEGEKEKEEEQEPWVFGIKHLSQELGFSRVLCLSNPKQVTHNASTHDGTTNRASLTYFWSAATNQG
jgi:hypothetical protein